MMMDDRTRIVLEHVLNAIDALAREADYLAEPPREVALARRMLRGEESCQKCGGVGGHGPEPCDECDATGKTKPSPEFPRVWVQFRNETPIAVFLKTDTLENSAEYAHVWELASAQAELEKLRKISEVAGEFLRWWQDDTEDEEVMCAKAKELEQLLGGHDGTG